jgi:2-phosphoglycerate kinase
LLLGGSSGSGKTTVAEQLSRRFQVALVQADSFRLLLQHAVSADVFPALHLLADPVCVAALTVEQRVQRWRAVAEQMSHALQVVIAFHVATDAPLIVEGDTLMPWLGARTVMAGIPVGRLVKTVFLYEPDRDRLYRNFELRGRGFDRLSTDERDREVEKSWRYGRWLAAEATRLGLPVVSSGSIRNAARRVLSSV